MSKRNFDVVVVGSGIAGLMTTVKLARLGFNVALIEREAELATSASTRNVGWVHSGAYHAGSVLDRDQAVAVAGHCAFGLRQISQHYSEIIENHGIVSHVIIKNADNLEEVKSRWDEAGVLAREISLKEAERCHPGSTISNSAAVFEVGDLSINTRMLYQRLIVEAQLYRAELIQGARIVELVSSDSGEAMRISIHGDDNIILTARIFIYATGHATRPLMQSLLGVDIPVRLWKSQMLLVNRLSRHNVYHADLDEVAIIHHRNVSIVNLSDDAVRVDKPDYELNHEGIAKIQAGLLRFLPGWDNGIIGVTACIKTDICSDQGRRRSLNVEIGEPRENHITIMPGKMTETPYLTDLVCRMVFDRIELGLISRRPMDGFLERIKP